jgi:hypothetical protein
MGKITFLTGAAVGYVLGARAGRERYEQIKAKASSWWGSPKVQDTVGEVRQGAADSARSAAGQAKDAAGRATSAVSDKVGGGSDSGSGSGSGSDSSGGPARTSPRTPPPSGLPDLNTPGGPTGTR